MQARLEHDQPQQSSLRQEEMLAAKNSPQLYQSLKAVRKPTRTPGHGEVDLRSRLAAEPHELRSRLMLAPEQPPEQSRRERKRSSEDLEGAISLASLGEGPSGSGNTYTLAAPVADHAAFAREVLAGSPATISVDTSSRSHQISLHSPHLPTTRRPPAEIAIRQPAGQFIPVTGNGYY